MAFRYLRDPLFLLCVVTCWIHRWLAARGMSTPLLRGHLNDLICVPFWVPIIVWLKKRLRLRKHDAPPDAVEVIVSLLIFAALFEVVIPAQEAWRVPTVADPYDVLSYCLGALLAVVFWRWYYRRRGVGVSQGVVDEGL
jgi:hypothetical protein